MNSSVRNLSKCCKTQVFCTFWVENVLGATAACIFLTSNLQKVVRTRQFFNILTCECASRHSGVPFFRIATSKMAPPLRCFAHFDSQMCFAPQRRASFPDRNFKNGSDNEVFCTFWLTNVLRATAACHFSDLVSAAPSAPAASTSLLFEHQEARIIEKTQRFATLLTFRVMDLLTWLLWYSCFLGLSCCATLLFCDLKTVPLCFSALLFNCPYCRKLDL